MSANCTCAYTLMRLQVVPSFSTLSFFTAYKAEPCDLNTYRHTLHALQGSAWATKSQPWVRTRAILTPWALLATPAQLAGESQAPNFQLLCSTALRTWSTLKNNREREGSSHTAPSSARMWAHPKERCCLCEGSQLLQTSGSSRSQWGTLCRGKTLPGTNPEFGCSARQAWKSQPLLEAGSYMFWAPVKAFPRKWPAPTQGARRSCSATRHKKEWRNGQKNYKQPVYSHYSLHNMLGTHTLVWKSQSKKKPG